MIFEVAVASALKSEKTWFEQSSEMEIASVSCEESVSVRAICAFSRGKIAFICFVEISSFIFYSLFAISVDSSERFIEFSSEMFIAEMMIVLCDSGASQQQHVSQSIEQWVQRVEERWRICSKRVLDEESERRRGKEKHLLNCMRNEDEAIRHRLREDYVLALDQCFMKQTRRSLQWKKRSWWGCSVSCTALRETQRSL